jgi:L,D-transpeptidase ErfK/SrfK
MSAFMVNASSRRELLLSLAGLACAARAAPAKAEGVQRPQEEIQRPQFVGEERRHVIRKGENLLDLARAYDMGFIELRAANPGVDAWAPLKGTEILIPGAHLLPYDAGHRVIVNLGDMRLYCFGPEPGAVRSFPIGIGREAHQTPLGVIPIVEKRVHPTWWPTPGQRRDSPGLPKAVPPGPDNPLGDYALRIGWNGYNIHGTNKPDSIGRQLTRGCIRLYPEDIETLFGLVEIGDEVRITDEPLKFGWVDGELYMEAHATGDQVKDVEAGRPIDPEPIEHLESHLAYAAGAHIRRVDWVRVRSLARERRGVPGRITI